ncbi:MAG: VCBS repeat-containing protein [Pirellulales bacterium]
MVAGEPLHMDLCMITPLAVDFNGDGHVDLVVGDEDGRVALHRKHRARRRRHAAVPAAAVFPQEAENVKFGAIASPDGVDLDGDGLEDLVLGNTAGYIGFIKNLGGIPSRWAAPVYLRRRQSHSPQAGPNGSPLGPSEAKWGYTNVNVGDWDGDGLLDLIVSDIWGRIIWYQNIGTKTAPQFAAGQPIEVAWDGGAEAGLELVEPERQRARHAVALHARLIDWNHDGLMDLITLDHEGYLAFFERRRTADGKLELLPGSGSSTARTSRTTTSTAFP